MHPTVKPVALVADAIRDCSKRKPIDLDPFDGSGTTVIAAEKTGRRAYVLELDPLYCDTIIRRWQAFTGKRALHADTGRSFEEMEELRMYNPYIRGWITYYGSFYRTQLRPSLKRIDLYVIRWARRKFKRLRRKTKGARDWFDRLRRANPTLFAHWQLCHGNGRTSGAV